MGLSGVEGRLSEVEKTQRGRLRESREDASGGEAEIVKAPEAEKRRHKREQRRRKGGGRERAER